MKCELDSGGLWITPQAMHPQASKALGNGATPASMAAALAVNVRSVVRRLAALAEGGQKALLVKPIPGRPPMLSGEQMSWLAGGGA